MTERFYKDRIPTVSQHSNSLLKFSLLSYLQKYERKIFQQPHSLWLQSTSCWEGQVPDECIGGNKDKKDMRPINSYIAWIMF